MVAVLAEVLAVLFFLLFQLSSLCFPFSSLYCKSMSRMFSFHWIRVRSATKLLPSSAGDVFSPPCCKLAPLREA